MRNDQMRHQIDDNLISIRLLLSSFFRIKLQSSGNSYQLKDYYTDKLTNNRRYSQLGNFCPLFALLVN